MKTIVVGLQKGGTGKSTTAVILALLLWLITGKRVLLVDADPLSQSTVDWRGIAGDNWPDGVTVIQRTRRITQGIADMGDGYEYIVIDTGGDNPSVLEDALSGADVLLAPIAPTPAEFRRVPPTVQTAQEVAEDCNPNLDLLVVLTKVFDDSDVDAKSIRGLLTGEGVDVLKAMIPNRKLYARMFGTFINDKDAYGAYGALVTELLGRLK